jgi:hypothetical protein
MRILSARVVRARRDRPADRVEALVLLSVEDLSGLRATHLVPVSVPARADGAPGLRHRLTAAARLSFALSPAATRERYRAA